MSTPSEGYANYCITPDAQLALSALPDPTSIGSHLRRRPCAWWSHRTKHGRQRHSHPRSRLELLADPVCEMGVTTLISRFRHEDRVCSSMTQPTPCLQATGPDGESAPVPTPQWAGAGWGGRLQRRQMSPSPQQLMPHTLKLQPERTQTLGKEKSEGAPRVGWRRWHPARGDSTDQPRHSWLQPAPRPGLPCGCLVPGGIRGPGLDDPSVTPRAPPTALQGSSRSRGCGPRLSAGGSEALSLGDAVSTPAPDQPLLPMFPQQQRVFIGPIVH